MKNRAFRTEGRGDARDRIGATGTGGGDHAAELARLPGIAVRRMRSDLFVAHVDDADAFIDATVIDVDDVPAAKSEDGVHPFVFQRLGDQMAAGDHARIAALPLQGIFGRRGFGRTRDGIYSGHMISKCVIRGSASTCMGAAPAAKPCPVCERGLSGEPFIHLVVFPCWRRETGIRAVTSGENALRRVIHFAYSNNNARIIKFEN